MTNSELIAKQQLEIEQLKEAIDNQKVAMGLAYEYAISVQQWSTNADKFPNVAMHAAIEITDGLRDYLPD